MGGEDFQRSDGNDSDSIPSGAANIPLSTLTGFAPVVPSSKSSSTKRHQTEANGTWSSRGNLYHFAHSLVKVSYIYRIISYAAELRGHPHQFFGSPLTGFSSTIRNCLISLTSSSLNPH